MQPLIPQLLDGFNVTCFAYGMTGSGKTYSMFGKINNRCQPLDLISHEQPSIETLKSSGLCDLAIQNLFYQMLQKQDDFTYMVKVSYLELYNEKVRDLLGELKDFD